MNGGDSFKYICANRATSRLNNARSVKVVIFDIG